MRNNYAKIFRSFKEVELPARLFSDILVRIRAREQCLRTLRFTLSFVSALISFTLIIPAIRLVGQELSQSGFYSYLSLIFSDGGAVLSSWKEFALLLAESLRPMGIAFFLATTFFLISSLKSMIKNMKVSFLSTSRTLFM